MARKYLGWLLASLFLLPSFLRADDWPQWRGPDRSGVSKETGLLKSWPKEGPKLAWVYKDAGDGFSSFAVVKGVVYTLGTRKDQEIVLALDAKDGKELWTAPIGPIFNFDGNSWGVGPRSTPTIDGDRLYALGGQGELVCVDLAKHDVVWRKNLIKDLNGVMMSTWGYSESPLIDGNLLICAPGGKDGTLAALDKTNGKVVWRTKDWTEKAPYSSPLVADVHGVKQYIQLGYTGGTKGASIAGVDPKNGKILWKESILKGDSYHVSPTPIVKGNLIYVTSGGSTGACHLFEIDANQKATDLYAKKMHKKLKDAHGGVVLVGDHIYGHSDPKTWVCQDFKTGEIAWDERNELSCASGAITSAEGLLYLFTDEGETALVPATPKEFKIVSSFALPFRSKIPATNPSSGSSKPWAHPVIANGHLFLRDHDLIFAFDIRGK